MGNNLKVKYKFGAGQVLVKKPFDFIVFLSHMKYGRKIKIEHFLQLILLAIFCFHEHGSQV